MLNFRFKGFLKAPKSTWWFQSFFVFTTYLGKWSNLTDIFPKWVAITTQDWHFPRHLITYWVGVCPNTDPHQVFGGFWMSRVYFTYLREVSNLQKNGGEIIHFPSAMDIPAGLTWINQQKQHHGSTDLLICAGGSTLWVEERSRRGRSWTCRLRHGLPNRSLTLDIHPGGHTSLRLGVWMVCFWSPKLPPH